MLIRASVVYLRGIIFAHEGIRKDYLFGQKFYIKGCKPKYQPKKVNYLRIEFLVVSRPFSRGLPQGAPVFSLLENFSYNRTKKSVSKQAT